MKGAYAAPLPAEDDRDRQIAQLKDCQWPTPPTPPRPNGHPGRAPKPAESPEPKRRHRALVWTLIVLASVLLIVSITANFVQRAALDTDQVADTTDQILADEDVQEALSIYLVDQVYANVDVQGQIEQELPSSAKALSAPIAAATQAARPERLGEGARLASWSRPSSPTPCARRTGSS